MKSSSFHFNTTHSVTKTTSKCTNPLHCLYYYLTKHYLQYPRRWSSRSVYSSVRIHSHKTHRPSHLDLARMRTPLPPPLQPSPPQDNSTLVRISIIGIGHNLCSSTSSLDCYVVRRSILPKTRRISHQASSGANINPALLYSLYHRIAVNI